MLHLFFLIVITLLFINAMYLFIFSVAGQLKKPINMQMCNPKSSYLILIPAYKEDFVILESVQSLLNINYPAYLFKIVVLADSFELETLTQLRKLHVEVVEIPEDKQRNKSKSIRYYLDNYINEMDVCLLLDADNCVDP